jgi:chemotaxis protein CheC
MSIALTELQRSALQEAGNIGSGHSAIALSQLMGKKIMIAIPSVEVYSVSDFMNTLLNDDKDFVFVSMQILGDISGAVMFCLSEEMARSLCRVVMGPLDVPTQEISEVEESALQEVGGIVGASYLNAINQMTDLSLLSSVPSFYTGKGTRFQSILEHDEVALKDVHKVICVSTEFVEASTKIDALLLFLPLDKSLPLFLSAMGV